MEWTMLFNSYVFVFAFLPIVLSGFFLFGRVSRQAAAGWLGAASVAFYAWGSPVAHTALFLISITGNYLLGRAHAPPLAAGGGCDRQLGRP
jgi:hypothetical protein